MHKHTPSWSTARPNSANSTSKLHRPPRPNSQRRKPISSPSQPSWRTTENAIRKRTRGAISSSVRNITPRAHARGAFSNTPPRNPRSQTLPTSPKCTRDAISNIARGIVSRVRARDAISNTTRNSITSSRSTASLASPRHALCSFARQHSARIPLPVIGVLSDARSVGSIQTPHHATQDAPASRQAPTWECAFPLAGQHRALSPRKPASRPPAFP